MVVWLACQTAAPLLANQDPLPVVRELYLSANYEGALAALNRLDSGTLEKRIDLADYRVLCLLALGRVDEARLAIRSIVETDPRHHLSEGQASPRLRSVFEDTRKAFLPELVQRLYADAKASFDQHDPRASEKFDRLIEVLDDPDLGNAQLSDLRAVASGFRDLSKVHREPEAREEEVRLKPDATHTPKPDATSAPLTGPPDRILVSSKGSGPFFTPKAPPPPGLEPPFAINQPIPQWSPRGSSARQAFHGTLEVTIDVQGSVTTVVLRQPMLPAFDAALIKAARTWTYKPALLNGKPVPFRKVIEIEIQPER